MEILLLAFARSLPVLVASSLLARGAVAVAADDLAALPWDELRAALPSGPGALVDASTDAYVSECLDVFTLPNPLDKSTHDLIDQPSGLCMAHFYCGFERCCPSREYLDLDGGSGAPTYEETLGVVTSYEGVVAGFEVEGWVEASNPAWDLPHKVLFPQVAGDVVAAVRFAGTHGLELSVKNSGHSYAGSSTKRDTLLINMNKYRRYATEGIGVVDCEAAEDAAAGGGVAADLSDQPCAHAAARGKPGALRVGGGENWDKAYRALREHNAGLPAPRYLVVGGNSATVSPMGWSWSGGLAGSVAGRLYGFGADQVLQIEAVLPNGEHVRFGPTAWESAEGYLVPRTTGVSGVCNANPEEPDERAWTWGACPQSIDFDDLWFAFRGGGGGTWGVVLSAHLQLHEYAPLEVLQASPGFPLLLTEGPSPGCAKLLEMDGPTQLLNMFLLEYFLDPEALGISREQSDACGAPPTEFFFCYGKGMGHAMAAALKSYTLALNETFTSIGFSQADVEAASDCFFVTEYNSFADWGLASSKGTPWEGRLKDDGANTFWALNEGELPILFPKAWLLQNKRRFVDLVPTTGANGLSKYYAFSGATEFGHDQTTSMSAAHRGAGLMIFIKVENADLYNDVLQEMYDFSGGDEFPAYVGANHLTPNAFGPLKSDWTRPCPTNFTRRERESLCVRAQEAVWGSETLRRLEAIKREIDPNGMFDCFRCVGNRVLVDDGDEGENLDPAPAPAGGGEPTSPITPASPPTAAEEVEGKPSTPDTIPPTSPPTAAKDLASDPSPDDDEGDDPAPTPSSSQKIMASMMLIIFTSVLGPQIFF